MKLRPQELLLVFVRSTKRVTGDDFLRSILSKTGLALCVKVTGAATSLAMFAVVARSMGESSFGIFAFAFSLATFLAIVAEAGQPNLAMRYMPVYRSDDDLGHVLGITRFGYMAVGGGAILLGVGLILVWLFFLPDRGELPVTGALVVLMAVLEYRATQLRAHGRLLSTLVTKELVWRVVTIASLALLGASALLEKSPWSDATTALLLVAGALGVSLLVLALLPTGYGAHTHRTVRPLYRTGDWFRASITLWLLALLQTGAQHANLSLSALVLPSTDVGGLFAAVRIAALLNFFLLAANLVAAPSVADLWHSGRLHRLQQLCTSVAVGAAIPTVLVYALLGVFGRDILSLFGSGYSEYYPSLVILSTAQLINCLCGQTGTLLTMTGYQRRLLAYVAFSNAIPLVGIPLLAGRLGVTYAAIAIASGLVLWNLGAAWWARRHLHLETTILGVSSLMRTHARNGTQVGAGRRNR